MDDSFLHEVEEVSFLPDKPRPLAELLRIFRGQGFTLHDDIVSLDRSDRICPWQHSSIVEVEIKIQDEEVFGFDEGVWDSMSLKYLFAFLPFALSDRFIRAVGITGERLGIEPIFRGQPVNAE